MEFSHKFFTNRDCQYFPCHTGVSTDVFNCLFCYCPLYVLQEACGGKFRYSDSGIKICMECDLPHAPEYYDVITAKLKEQLAEDMS